MTIDVGRVAMIPIESVVIEDRYRKDLGDLDETEISMKKSGLTTPLTFQDLHNGTYRLLAGERRFTILLTNGNSEIPARIYDRELTELEMLMIEEAENIHRKDFEPWEHDALVARIHKLHQDASGMSAPGPNQTGHKQSDTGNMLGMTQPAVAAALERHEMRETFPELFENCKTAKDATKVVKKIKEEGIKRSIAEQVDKNKEGDLAKLANCYINRDFFEGIKEIPDDVVHLVEIDPPYGIDLTKGQMKKSDGESQYNKTDYNEIPSTEYQVFLAKVFAECYRVMANHSWLICWFAPEPWFDIVYQELNNAGFRTTRMVGEWTKPGGQCNQPETRLANSYEMFFYAWKGSPALNKQGRSNIFDKSEFPMVPAQLKTHPTERPIELMKEIYDTFAFPGSRVLIPFLGSGNGILAAHQLGMEVLGFELSKSYRDSFLVKLNSMR